MSEWGVGLEVKTLPILVEGLQAELPRLLHGPDGHVGQHGGHIMAATNLQESNRIYQKINKKQTPTPHETVCYLAGALPGEGLHHFVNAVVRNQWSVVEELLVRHLIAIDEECVRHQRVPVVELTELQSDAVPVLELAAKQQHGVELQLEKVSTELLHVLLYHYLYGLSWKKHKGKFLQESKSVWCLSAGWEDK